MSLDCGCGELSASPQCDDDGVCDCINGGSGSKCEGCEAGYIGESVLHVYVDTRCDTVSLYVTRVGS